MKDRRRGIIERGNSKDLSIEDWYIGGDNSREFVE